MWNKNQAQKTKLLSTQIIQTVRLMLWHYDSWSKSMQISIVLIFSKQKINKTKEKMENIPWKNCTKTVSIEFDEML